MFFSLYPIEQKCKKTCNILIISKKNKFISKIYFSVPNNKKWKKREIYSMKLSHFYKKRTTFGKSSPFHLPNM